MKASQFIFKTIYLWALGELAGRKDILKGVASPLRPRKDGSEE